MPNQSESGRDRTQRREHDRRARAYELITSNPYHLSKVGRMMVLVLTVVVVIALTGFLARGLFHW